jgi:hypothetical protein
MKAKTQKIAVIRSVWRRLKKGRVVKVRRDLEAVKDVKGGGVPGPSNIPPLHLYDIRPRKDKRGVDLISDVLRFGCLWYAGPNAIGNAIKFAKVNSRSHEALIRVYDEAGNVIDRHAHAGEFKEW